MSLATNGTYLITFDLTLTTEGIDRATDDVTALVAAIPNFVWDDLGIASPVR